MELVKDTKEHKIYKKKTGRYAVKGLKGKWLNGDDKVRALLKAGLVKTPAPKPKEAKAEAAPAPAAAKPKETTKKQAKKQAKKPEPAKE